MPFRLSFEQYSSLAKLDKDAKAEDYSKEMEDASGMSLDDLFGKYGADVLPMHTVVDLKEELKKYDLSTAGRKQDMVDRLAEHFESSKKRKHSEDSEESDDKKQKLDLEGKNLNNVLGGYKATVHNPNVSEEAKENAQAVLDDMGVDADEKLDSKHKLSSEPDLEGKNLNNVAGGYKAALHNPNVSDEAKENAQEVLDKMGVDADEKVDSKSRGSEDLSNSHVIGGYKATLHNASSSEEAKEHARKMLKEAGVDEDEEAPSKKSDAEKDETHVIGGYRATLSNPNTSEEAKDAARKALKEMGADPEERLAPKPDYSTTDVDLKGKDQTHVIAGYKATLVNESASKEAKDHARKVLEEMGVDPEERLAPKADYSSTEVDTKGKDETHVIAGYKATLSNAAASKEAKDHARKVLEEMGVDADARVEHGSEYAGQTTADGKNLGNVVGGYKATLSNPLASDEAKEGARAALDQIAKSQ